MKNNNFFKPTPLYKEYMLLDLIEHDPNITQRLMSEKLGIAASMVNIYLEEYEKKGYIIRNYISAKVVKYMITKNGVERKKLLNISYLKASQTIYQSAKDNIVSFLKEVILKGFKKLLLYGAGEVAEILLQVITTDDCLPIEVVGVIDDDNNKKSKYILNKKIMDKDQINVVNHDGILISSYTNNDEIYQKLVAMNYDKKRIVQFFQS